MRRPTFARPRGGAGAVALLAGLVLVLGAALFWLRDSSLMRVQQVDVTGLSGPDARRVRAALEDAARDMTTLHVREDALRAAVEAYPIVRDVHADAKLPHRLRIEVVEHVPVGVVVAAGRRVAVAADGTVLRGALTQGLPEISAKVAPAGDAVSDARLRRAVALLAAAPAPLRHRVRRLYVGPLGWGAPLRNGPTLWFGHSDRLPAKWAAATAVLQDAGAAGATYVDLRLPERPAAGGLEPLPPPEPSPST